MCALWESVTESYIANCFKLIGFKPANAITDTMADVPVANTESMELANAIEESRDPGSSDNFSNMSVVTSLNGYLGLDQMLKKEPFQRLLQQLGRKTVKKPATTRRGRQPC